MGSNTRREAIIKELRMLGPLSCGHFADVGNSAADMLEADDQEIKRLEQSRIDEADTTNRAAQASRDLLTKAMNQAQQVASPDVGGKPCNPHPDAPHGFSRNASHSAGRYVCDCEGWIPEWSAESAQGARP